jgi:hypothetical protein
MNQYLKYIIILIIISLGTFTLYMFSSNQECGEMYFKDNNENYWKDCNCYGFSKVVDISKKPYELHKIILCRGICSKCIMKEPVVCSNNKRICQCDGEIFVEYQLGAKVEYCFGECHSCEISPGGVGGRLSLPSSQIKISPEEEVISVLGIKNINNNPANFKIMFEIKINEEWINLNDSRITSESLDHVKIFWDNEFQELGARELSLIKFKLVGPKNVNNYLYKVIIIKSFEGKEEIYDQQTFFINVI